MPRGLRDVPVIVPSTEPGSVLCAWIEVVMASVRRLWRGLWVGFATTAWVFVKRTRATPRRLCTVESLFACKERQKRADSAAEFLVAGIIAMAESFGTIGGAWVLPHRLSVHRSCPTRRVVSRSVGVGSAGRALRW